MYNYQDSFKMEEERKQKEFLNWASENISYCDKLTPEELQKLRKYYEEDKIWSQVLDRTFNAAMYHNKSGIDYSTDLEKARIRSTSARESLSSYIATLNFRYGNGFSAEPNKKIK